MIKKVIAILSLVALFITSVFTVNVLAEESQDIKTTVVDDATAEPLRVLGVDVSNWQGQNINWQKVKAAGIDFAIIRVGYSEVKDKSFEINYANAKAAGIKLGCYMYSYADFVSEAQRDAKDVMRWIEGKQFEYPIYYDMEDEAYQGHLTTKERTDIALEFVKILKENGYYSGVYANKYWFTEKLDYNAISSQCETWIAHYTEDTLDYSNNFGMWQYSETGRVEGITGNVDMNVCYKDYPGIVEDLGLNGLEKPYTYLPYTGIKGDVNGDGIVTLSDVSLLAQYVAGWTRISLVKEALNVDGDELGAVTLTDVSYLAQMIAGWEH